MRLGCIDIGSNTTRLLVADCDGRRLQVVRQERSFTRIANELFEHGALSEAKIAEVVAVVAAQVASAHRERVSEIRAVGTEAIRRAANGAELVRAITAATGLEIDVLSGEQEARLAFIGAAAALEEPVVGELGVVDVGGGSSELVVGRPPSQIGWWASIGLGSATITHIHLHHDPPQPAEIVAARADIARALAPLIVPEPAVAVAVGGSATCVALLAGGVLDPGALADTLGLLAAEPSAEVALRHAIDPRRARLLPAGLLVLAGVAEAFGTTLGVGRGGIREGVLLEAAGR